MTKARLLIVNGHGGSDPGAVRTVAGVDLRERDLNIEAVLAANDYIGQTYLTAPTVIDVLTYPEGAPFDGDSGLLDKIAKANALGRDLLGLELHHNIAASGTGAQIWTSQNAASTPGDETAIVAPLLSAELAKVVGDVVPILTSDHSRFRKLGWTDDTVGTCILVELRRVDLATTPEGRYATGAAIAKACAAYFRWPAKGDDTFAARLARAQELAKQIVQI